MYYLRIGFIASAYINQLGEPPLHTLPATIAVPLCHVCKVLKRPPILSYDGYALYNWKRLDPAGPIALGNTDTVQNFVPLYDEHWFILVHVEIEAIAARILDAVARIQESLATRDYPAVDTALIQIAEAVEAQTCVLQRIPEKMDHRLYHRTFRKYIHRHTDDPRGTGGTPFMQWLHQLIDETRAARLPV